VRCHRNAGIGVKYFWPNPTYAFAFGNWSVNNGYGPQHILFTQLLPGVHYTQLPVADLAQYHLPNVTMIVIQNQDLNKLGPAAIIGHIP